MKNKQAVKKSLSQWCIKNYKNSEKGASKHENINKYHCKAVISACTNNLSISSLLELSKSKCDNFLGLNVGDQFDNPTIYIPMVHKTLLNDIMIILHTF